MHILVTGSLGLVGSTTVRYFLEKGHFVSGIDNNMRQTFFGSEGSTLVTQAELEAAKTYTHYVIDVRNKAELETVFTAQKFDAIIHTAAQPSHDKAKDIPLLDFEVNAQGTLNLLELTRTHTPNAVFIFTSTNKVYGDTPNCVPLVETATRLQFKNPDFLGFDESTSIDQTTHSLFGASKLAADIYVQEYGRYFGLKTTVLRLGCITGKAHSGVKLHGFLSYLVRSLLQTQSYEIIGYGGKQVRDQIHALDLARAFEAIIARPTKGEVFNLGGGPKNTISVLEAIESVSQKLAITPHLTITSEPRKGDHQCYISDIRKFKKTYPNWRLTFTVDAMITELLHAFKAYITL